MKNLLPKRIDNSNKGTYGTVLNVSGCDKYRGAAYLSCVSALRIGAGRVVLSSEPMALQAVATMCPETILLSRKDLNSIEDYSVVMVGCGLSKDRNAKNVFKKILSLMKDSDKPLLIDADGLNLLSEGSYVLPKNTVLTPHPREMSRLMGVNVELVLENPEHWIIECAKKYKSTVVLKLHETLICDTTSNWYKNNTGNSALAKAGTGDVLAGMIAGLMSQGLNTFDACRLGVFIHGKAGEIASEEMSEYSVLASDVVNNIGKVILEM